MGKSSDSQGRREPNHATFDLEVTARLGCRPISLHSACIHRSLLSNAVLSSGRLSCYNAGMETLLEFAVEIALGLMLLWWERN